MIFGAHAAIADATKELESSDSYMAIKNSFEMPLPATSLDLIGAMILQICDRISDSINSSKSS